MTEETLYNLAQGLGKALQHQELTLAVAESCTGGWLAQAVTSVSGSSAWFDRGFVTYTDAAKQEMLGVKIETLAKYGAVCEAVVREMTAGALRASHAKVAAAISGIAGPDGGSSEKSVGTVWFAWEWAEKSTRTDCQHFEGDRRSVREQAVQFILERLIEMLESYS